MEKESETARDADDWDGHNCWGWWADTMLFMAGIDFWQAMAMVLAVVGVLFNNAQLRVCFVLWVVSNMICLVYHLRSNLRWLAVRDIIFTVLAIIGWFQWG